MKNCLSGELVDLLGLTDILGSLQANSVLQLQSFLDALVLCVFLYVLVLFTTYISEILVYQNNCFLPEQDLLYFCCRRGICQISPGSWFSRQIPRLDCSSLRYEI